MSREQLFNLEDMVPSASTHCYSQSGSVKYVESSSTFSLTGALAEMISLDDHFQNVVSSQSCDHDTNPQIHHIQWALHGSLLLLDTELKRDWEETSAPVHWLVNLLWLHCVNQINISSYLWGQKHYLVSCKRWKQANVAGRLHPVRCSQGR